jgi:hypothetical protein
VDDEATEAEITALENECNDVLFCTQSELFHWSSHAYIGPPSGQSTTVTDTYEFLDVQPSLDSQDA